MSNDSIIGTTGNDSLDGRAGNDSVYGGTGNDTILGGEGADLVYGGGGDDVLRSGDPAAHLQASGTVQSTWNAIRLGTFADMDSTEGNGLVENPNLLQGTHGTTAAPLSDNIVRVVTNDSTADGRIDNNDYGGAETLIIGGTARTIDTVLSYTATVTFADGSSYAFTAIVFQTTDGAVYLAPPTQNDAVAQMLTSQPIKSLTLGQPIDNVSASLYANRYDAQFQGAGYDTVHGDAGNDTIEGGAGNDLFYGGTGADSISSGGGADTIYGGDQNDTVNAGAGNDLVFLGDGNDVFGDWSADNSGNDTVHGDGGNDRIIGGSGNDLVFGGEGDDTLSGQTGFDTLHGGGGNDQFHVTDDHEGNVIHGDDGTDLIAFSNWLTKQGVVIKYTGSGAGSYNYVESPAFLAQGGGSFDGIEHIALTSFDDALYAGADTVGVEAAGWEGNDTIYGGLGADSFYGGGGADQIYGDAGDDLIDGGDGDDALGGDAGNDTVLGGAGRDYLQGMAGNDSLDGGEDADMLFGGGGNDTLQGGSGGDTLSGGAGDDRISGGSGTDTVIFSGRLLDYSFARADDGGLIVTDGVAGRDGQDTLDGVEHVVFGGVKYHLVTGDNGSNTTLQAPDDGTPSLIIAHDDADWGGGHATSDVVFGGAGDDTLDGGDGDDTLIGEGDDDLLRGDGGNDALYGGDGDDTLQGGDGNDLLKGGEGADSIDGGAGEDTVLGGGGNDTIEAGSGNDSVSGDDGDDLISSSTGASTLDGGSGNDTLSVSGDSADAVLSGGEGSDRIVVEAPGLTFVSVDGGEDAAGGDTDILDLGVTSGAATLDMTGAESGTVTDDTGTVTFEGIERVELGAGDDTVNADGGFGPMSLGGGAGYDVLNVTGTPLPGSALDGIDGSATGFFTTKSGAVISFGPAEERQLPDLLETYKTGTVMITGTNMAGTVGDYSFDGFEEINVSVICFVRGTRIKTERGEVAIEELAVGDRVLTLDNGYQAVRWIGSVHRPAQGALAPVRIRAGAMGNERDLLVSQQHRVLLRGWQASLLFGESEVLLAAKTLVNDRSIRIEEGGAVEYFHMLFDRHEIVFAEGTPSESFHPGVEGWSALDEAARTEILALFPELADNGFAAYGQTARLSLKAYEGRALSRLLHGSPDKVVSARQAGSRPPRPRSKYRTSARLSPD